MVPQKNHLMLLDAFARVHETLPTARLLCVGGGPPEHLERLLARVRQLRLDSVVTLAPARDDPEAVFNAADVAVLSSDAEGFPNTIAESLACGTPCVSTAVGAAPALLPAGCVTPLGDVDAFADAVVAALTARPSTWTARRSLLPGSYTPSELASRTLDALRTERA
jgi:glycosyltransferase involved in cell wall biosynthesis